MERRFIVVIEGRRYLYTTRSQGDVRRELEVRFGRPVTSVTLTTSDYPFLPRL